MSRWDREMVKDIDWVEVQGLGVTFFFQYIKMYIVLSMQILICLLI